MADKNRAFFWLAGAVIAGWFVYSVSSILLPFIVAVIAAYFLSPAADSLKKFGLSRNLSAIVITVSFFIVATAITALLIPVFYNQFVNLLHTIPTYITYIKENIVPAFSNMLRRIDPETVEKAKDSVGSASEYTMKFIGTLVTNLLSSGMAALNLLSLLFITPIVTFYMLRDWHVILDKINGWLPLKYAGTIRAQAREIDLILAGYIRGQTQVCLIIGAYYAIALTIANLEFSVFIGLASGILLFVPYVGALFGFAISMLVAFFQFGDMEHLIIIAGIFIAGQVLESMFITPNLVGNKVRLHPAWIMFALLAGGAMLGFIGVLLAIPVAAVIGVIVRFTIGQYLHSPAYLGAAGSEKI